MPTGTATPWNVREMLLDIGRDLGDYLRSHVRQAAPALASHLAAALIRVLTGAEGTDIPGTDLSRLLPALSPDPAAAEQALRELIAQARALAQAPPENDDR